MKVCLKKFIFYIIFDYFFLLFLDVENSNENEENMSTKSNNSSLNLAQSAGSASKRNINVKIGSNQKSTNNRTNVVRKAKKNYKLNDEDDDEMVLIFSIFNHYFLF